MVRPTTTRMNSQTSTLKFQILFLLALTGWACADLPKKAPISRYATLWNNSPFTSKPPPPEAVDAPNPLDDYSLIGVSSLGSGTFRVTILNKKKPDEPRKYIESNRTTDGFRILEVIRKPGDPTGTTVRMQSGSLTGTISYDEKLLTLTPAAPQAPPGLNPPGVPPQPVPAPVDASGQPMRQPRPRVVPPPTHQAGAPGQPPLPNNGQPVQPQQQRPSRRGN
jgi:hypothetical protein